MREMFEPLNSESMSIFDAESNQPVLTSGSDIGRIDTMLMGSSPRLGSVTRMDDWSDTQEFRGR